MRAMAIGGLAAVVIVAAVAAIGVWYVYLRGDEPPPVTLAGAIDAVDDETADGTVAPFTTSGRQELTDERASALAGTWEIKADRSFVGYRVREELAGLGATTAVGRTSSVSGTIEFDGETITAVEVTADLRDLESDDSRRDRQLRRQALETDEYPDAEFSLTEPVEIGRPPPDRVALRVTVPGDLTLRGVTRSLEVPLEGQLVGDTLVVVGSMDIAFEDFEIRAPAAPLVITVDDNAVMELQLILEQS